MLDCQLIQTSMSQFSRCERTDAGFMVATHCLYPSFEAVSVFVVGYGEGFIVHDSGRAAHVAWKHGFDDRAFKNAAQNIAKEYGCSSDKGQISCQVPSSEWLWSAISTVANASADTVRTLLRKPQKASERNIIRQTKNFLDSSVWSAKTVLNEPVPGQSGKVHTFDLAVHSNDDLTLVDEVTAHPNSIAAKYLAFSDVATRPGVHKYALYDGELASEDKVLLSNVADLLDFSAVERSRGQVLLQ